jgi:hypothetical protein
VAGNKVFLATIAKQTNIRRGVDGKGLQRVKGWASAEDVMRMGPSLFSKAVSTVVFGSSTPIDHPTAIRDARAALHRVAPLIITAKEVWCGGIVIKYFDGCKRVSRQPLYEHYNITPWSDALRKRWASRLTPRPRQL